MSDLQTSRQYVKWKALEHTRLLRCDVAKRMFLPILRVEICVCLMLVTSSADWIQLPVLPAQESRAKEIRSTRDARYPNLFKEAATDARWVGDVGELVLLEWLVSNQVENVRWLTEDAAGKADFVSTAGITIGAKTVKRKHAPKIDYTAQISARHVAEPSDWFVFMNYSLSGQTLWILGAIESHRFMREARYYGPGDKVHADYEIRPGHEIYNLPLQRLITPTHWLDWLRTWRASTNLQA